MVTRQAHVGEIQPSLTDWLNGALNESIAGYIIAKSINPGTDTDPIRNSWLDYRNYTHDRMVMLAHSKGLTERSSTVEAPELVWTKVLLRHVANGAPRQLDANNRLSEYATEKRSLDTELSRNRTQFRITEFKLMLERLRRTSGEPVTTNICFSPLLPELIRKGEVFLEEPTQYGRIQKYQRLHRSLLKRVMAGQPISIADSVQY